MRQHLGAALGLGLLAAPLGAQLAPTRTGGEARKPVSEQRAGEIQAFLDRHDQLLRDGALDPLRKLYAEDFYSADLGNPCPDTMIEHWRNLHQRYPDFQLDTMPMRMEEVGEYYSVLACRPFEANHWGRKVEDDFCHAIILRAQGDRLSIASIFEVDHEKLAHLEQSSGLYRSPTGGFEVRCPPDFLPIPSLTTGTRLDEVRFVQPAHRVQIAVSLLDPSMPLSLEHAVMGDQCEPEGSEREVVTRAEPFHLLPDLDGVMCEVRYRQSLCQPMFRDSQVASVYLTPDHRLLLAVKLFAPTEHYAGAKQALMAMLQTLKVHGAGEEGGLVALLARADRSFDGVDDGVWSARGDGVELAIPDGLQATPLLGPGIHRLRLTPEEDPGCYLVLRVYPPAQAGEQGHMMKRAETALVRSRKAAGCRLVHRGEPRLRPALGGQATDLALRFRSAEGTECEHRIVGLTRHGHHVQLQLHPTVPGGAQPALLDAVLESLRWAE